MKNKKNIVGVVLAGGEGIRLRPLTYYFQKCMIPIGTRQKPLLEHILYHLKRHSIIDVKLLVGYKQEQIINYFNDGHRFGINIDYFVDDPSLRGSGGALLNAAVNGAFSNVDFLLLYYGDILTNINLSEMAKQHIESGSTTTLAMTNGYKVPVGVAELTGKSVKKWVEKPTINIFTGIGVVILNPDALKMLKDLSIDSKNIDIMRDFIPLLLKRGEKVEAYVFDSFWYDLGSTEKYEKIDNEAIDKLYHQETS